MNRVLNAGADQSALALTALTAAIAGGAVVGGLLSGVAGERLTATLGVIVSAAGIWLATGWGVETGLDRLARDLAIFGAGFGLTVSPRATAAVEAAGASAYGVASAMLQITRTLGMSIGLALLTSIGQNRIDELTRPDRGPRHGVTPGASSSAALSSWASIRAPACSWSSCWRPGRAARRPTCCA